MLPPQAIASAVAAMTAQNYGAGLAGRVKNGKFRILHQHMVQRTGQFPFPDDPQLGSDIPVPYSSLMDSKPSRADRACTDGLCPTGLDIRVTGHLPHIYKVLEPETQSAGPD